MMAKFNYVLSYDPAVVSPNPAQLNVFISKHRDIEAWYYPFVGTYVLKSNLALLELISEFGTFFGSSPFFLTWAPNTYLTGNMPPQVWEWVNNLNNPLLPSS